MKGCRLIDRHTAGRLVVAPLLPRYKRIRGPVIYLPVMHGIFTVINTELLLKKTFHQADSQLTFHCHRRAGHKETLLQLILILPGPFIMIPYHANGGINSIACI